MTFNLERIRNIKHFLDLGKEVSVNFQPMTDEQMKLIVDKIVSKITIEKGIYYKSTLFNLSLIIDVLYLDWETIIERVVEQATPYMIRTNDLIVKTNIEKFMRNNQYFGLCITSGTKHYFADEEIAMMFRLTFG